MSGLTWARNESDNQALSIKELSDSVLKVRAALRANNQPPLKAIRLSRETLLAFPLVYGQEGSAIATFYGIPVEIDDSLALFEYKEIYA